MKQTSLFWKRCRTHTHAQMHTLIFRDDFWTKKSVISTILFVISRGCVVCFSANISSNGSTLALLFLILSLPLYILFQGEISIWKHYATYAVIISWTSANLFSIMYYNYIDDQIQIWKCTKADVNCYCVSDQIRKWKQQLLAFIVRAAPTQFCRQIWTTKIKWLFTSYIYLISADFETRILISVMLVSICLFQQYLFKRSFPTLKPNVMLPAVMDSFFFLPNWSHFIRSNFDKDSNCHPILRQWQDQYEFLDDKYYCWVSTKKQRKWKIHVLEIKTVRGTCLPWSTSVWILLTTIDAVHVDGWGRTDGLCQSNSEGKRAPSALVRCHFGNVGVN